MVKLKILDQPRQVDPVKNILVKGFILLVFYFFKRFFRFNGVSGQHPLGQKWVFVKHSLQTLLLLLLICICPKILKLFEHLFSKKI